MHTILPKVASKVGNRRQTSKPTGRQTIWQTYGEKDRQADGQTDGEKDRQTGKRRDRQADEQTDGEKDRQRQKDRYHSIRVLKTKLIDKTVLFIYFSQILIMANSLPFWSSNAITISNEYRLFVSKYGSNQKRVKNISKMNRQKMNEYIYTCPSVQTFQMSELFVLLILVRIYMFSRIFNKPNSDVRSFRKR